jgi:hypothetical protein
MLLAGRAEATFRLGSAEFQVAKAAISARPAAATTPPRRRALNGWVQAQAASSIAMSSPVRLAARAIRAPEIILSRLSGPGRVKGRLLRWHEGAMGRPLFDDVGQGGADTASPPRGDHR